MILNKLQEALEDVGVQRKALDEVEAQLRSMIAKLGGVAPPESFSTQRAYVPQFAAVQAMAAARRRSPDKLDGIADVLRAEGRPLHITVIAERLSRLRGKKIDRKAIEPGLNRHIAKTKEPRIAKFGPSIYGLPEWKNQEPALTQIAS